MVAELRVNVASVAKEMDMAMRLLTEARVMSRYRKVFKGKGLEFEDFRDYTTDDDASEIDWRASKRANKLIIRRFKEERDMSVYFLVDVSSSMLFGSTDKLKHEYAAELVAAFSHFIIQSGDRAGLVMFTDKVVKYLGPGKSENHFYIMLRQLLTPEFYGGQYNLSNALNFVMNTTAERSLAFIVSDFIGLEKGWDSAIKQASGKFDGVAVMVRDPRDQRLPPDVGQVVIADPFSDREMLIDCNDKEGRMEYESYSKKEEEKIKDTLKNARWDMLEVTTDKSFVIPLIEFLKRREIAFR